MAAIARRRPVRGLSRRWRRGSRVVWPLVDQAISSLSNVAVSIYAAHVATSRAFGGFGLALSIYFLAVSVGRGVTSAPLTIKYTGSNEATWHASMKGAAGS